MAAVRRYAVLDTPPEEALDRIVALAAALFDVPFAVVGIVDTERIWSEARHGLALTQLGRGPGLCGSALFGTGPSVVTDALLDARGVNPLVAGEFGLRFYAGVPLTTPDGHHLGALGVFDTEPRRVAEEEVRVSTCLASRVVREWEVRRGGRPRTAGVNTEHVEVSALLGGYVLGAGEADVAAAVERHLAGCTACANEEAALREAASWTGGCTPSNRLRPSGAGSAGNSTTTRTTTPDPRRDPSSRRVSVRRDGPMEPSGARRRAADSPSAAVRRGCIPPITGRCHR
jgi:hypothetical protein